MVRRQLPICFWSDKLGWGRECGWREGSVAGVKGVGWAPRLLPSPALPFSSDDTTSCEGHSCCPLGRGEQGPGALGEFRS